MKKGISVLLALCLLFCCVSAAFAADVQSETDYPVIIVPGYGASPLFLENEDGTLGEQVWGWNIFADRLLEQVKQKFPQILSGAALLSVGSAKQLGKALGEAAVDMLGALAFNGDGESVNKIVPLPNDPARCRFDVFEDYFDEDLYSEKEIGRAIDDYVPRSRIYNFAVDFRYGAEYNAEKLDAFITAVKEYTGSEKVNLYAVSHGGQVTAAYLSMFAEKGDVNNAVLTVPAIGGSYVAYDILSGNIAFDEEELLVFIENALYLEQDFEWLFKTQPLEFMDDVLLAMLPYLKQVAGLWESLWDFLPYDCYKECFDTVDKTECAGLIAKVTDFHENRMVHFGEALREARALGVNVSIVAGTGHATITGSQQNSDAIIGTAAATGAKAAPYGKRFANGYTCTGTVCTDRTHNHLSPSMELDASYAYLPENTWFVDGMFHGMTMNEGYAHDLAVKLLLTNDLPDVHADPAFPQFRASENMANSVYADFTGGTPGYITAGAKEYVVTNVSEEYDCRIIAIRADGLDITFEGDYRQTLKPGESAVFTVKGEIPAVSAARAAVTVTFQMKNSVTPLNERTFRYTVDNGLAVAYNTNEPYADVDFTTPIADLLPGGAMRLVQKLGLTDWFSLWYSIIAKLIQNFKALFNK